MMRGRWRIEHLQHSCLVKSSAGKGRLHLVSLQLVATQFVVHLCLHPSARSLSLVDRDRSRRVDIPFPGGSLRFVEGVVGMVCAGHLNDRRRRIQC